MQKDKDPTQKIQVPVTRVNATQLIDQLASENFILRQENNELKQSVDVLKCTIDELANTLAAQKEMIQQLKDEIARLNGRKPKPNISPSKLEGNKGRNFCERIKLQDTNNLLSLWTKSLENLARPPMCCCFSAAIADILAIRSLEISSLARRIIKLIKRRGSKRGQSKGKPRKKKTELLIHDHPVIQPANLPDCAIFKGYQRYMVQDIIFKVHTTQYRLARWQLPDGSYVKGELPSGIHGHYGPELIAYVLHQYYVCRVTENLLLEELRSRGVLISAGQLSNILIQNKIPFQEEVNELLPTAVWIDHQIQVDDTGGRHKGKNQYTTVIGNEWFSVFATTESKSRINFLKLLQGGKEEYIINDDTLEFIREANESSYLLGYITLFRESKFTCLADWEQFLKERNITRESEVRMVTEAALYASVITNGIPRDLGVHSDDAGQFDAFEHSLCWIHEERHYRKLIMTDDQARVDLERVRKQIWEIYNNLKAFKENPSEEAKQMIEKQFDEIFEQNTSSPTLNHQLKKTYKKKEELLLSLERSATPLHNNSSETDARAAKIKLKISGGTRSDLGKLARDTFLSLKQTCLKLGINFISFLQDRVHGLYKIPKLAEIIRQRSSQQATAPPIANSA
jgi:hypothetical protein